MYKKSFVKESFILILLTIPYHKGWPFAYNLFPGSGNANRFVNFMADAAHHVEEGAVIGDNLSVHAQGPSMEAGRQIWATKGVDYWLLPTYSPELNPCEIVFSFIKEQLRDFDIHSSLFLSILEALKKITPGKILGFYERCGYLKKKIKEDIKPSHIMLTCEWAAWVNMEGVGAAWVTKEQEVGAAWVDKEEGVAGINRADFPFQFGKNSSSSSMLIIVCFFFEGASSSSIILSYSSSSSSTDFRILNCNRSSVAATADDVEGTAGVAATDG